MFLGFQMIGFSSCCVVFSIVANFAIPCCFHSSFFGSHFLSFVFHIYLIVIIFFIVEHILEYVFNCVKRSDINKLIAAVFMFVINISCVVSK